MRIWGDPHDPSQPVVVQSFPYPLPHDIQSQVSRLSETELSQRLQAAGLDYIRQQPGDWLALVGRKLVGSWWFRDNLGAAYEASWTRYYRPIYALLLAMLGIGLIISRPRWRHYSLLYLLFVFYTLSNLAFHVQTRYRWEIEPFFLIFAALATVTLAARTRWGRRFGDSGRAAV